MTWVKLDDGYFSNGKARESGGKGRLLHLASACYSAANLSDGRIPKHVVPLLLVQAQVPKSTVAVLVRLNLWHDQGDHYLLHDWQDYIRSKADVEKERRRWKMSKRESRRESTVDTHEDSPVDSAVESQRPDPTRPVNDLHPPTTEHRYELNGREGEVLRILLTAERNTSGPVRNRPAWERTVTERLANEHGPRITRLVAEYPDAPPDVIASHLTGDSSSLRYYTRKPA